MATHENIGSKQFLLVKDEGLNGLKESLIAVEANTQKIAPSIVDHKYYLLDGYTQTNRIDESTPALIQSLTYRSNHRRRPMLFRLGSTFLPTDNLYQKVLSSSDGQTIDFADITPYALNQMGGENSMFKLLKYEEGDGNTGDYIIMLKKSVYAPLGFTIRVQPNTNPTERSILESSVLFFSSEVN